MVEFGEPHQWESIDILSINPIVEDAIMAQVFISYSRRDITIVDNIINHLQNAGIDVWVDRSGIQAGELWRSQIVEAIAKASAFVLILSPNSIQSDNVRKELDLAESEKRRILPVLISHVELPPTMRYQLAGVQMIDMAPSFSAGIGRLIEALGMIKPASVAKTSHQKPTSRLKGALIGAGISQLVLVIRLLVDILIDALSLRLSHIPSLDIPYAAGMIIPYAITGAITGAVFALSRKGFGWVLAGVPIGIFGVYLILGGEFTSYDDALKFGLYLGIPAGALLGTLFSSISRLFKMR